MKSESIAKLAEALSKAQGSMQLASKDKDNPFFKSTYADLASVWEACRWALSQNQLAVTQTLSLANGEVYLTTTLMHSSGEWVSSLVPCIPTKKDPQGLGSAITYMRRFSLAALVGVASVEKPIEESFNDDDDGNAACGKESNQYNGSKGKLIAPVIKPVEAKVNEPGPIQLEREHFVSIRKLLKKTDDEIKTICFKLTQKEESKLYTLKDWEKVNLVLENMIADNMDLSTDPQEWEQQAMGPIGN